MNKKKLIIIAPSPSYGASGNLIEAINEHSRRFTAEGIYADSIPYGFLKKEQKKYWSDLTSLESIEYLLEALYDPDIYFFGISGRSLDMLEILFKLDYCREYRGDDKIQITDLSEENGTPYTLGRMSFIGLCLAAKSKGLFRDWETLLEIIFPDSLHTTNEKLRIVEEYTKRLTGRLASWWTDTTYRENSENLNRYIDIFNIQAFAMLDLVGLHRESLPLMQTYDFKYISEKKKGEFSVIHTPGLRESHKKGSDIVKKVASKIPKVKINIYGKENQLPNKDIIIEKAQSHVCIDKITDTCGGVGKSGLEAMYFGVPTICSLQDTKAVGRYADMPAIDVRNEEQLEKELERLSSDKDYYDRIAKKTKDWSRVLSYESTVEYLDEVLYNG